jgi:predicted nucleotidyltransferase
MQTTLKDRQSLKIDNWFQMLLLGVCCKHKKLKQSKSHYNQAVKKYQRESDLLRLIQRQRSAKLSFETLLHSSNRQLNKAITLLEDEQSGSSSN